MDLGYAIFFFEAIVFLFAISVHESAHAWTASRLGDPTARMLGRVSLNPIKHIDPIGTILLPTIAILTHIPVIGWAKPTPVDPRNFKNAMVGDILTSVAGPVSNFLVALAALVLLALIALTSATGHDIVKGLSMSLFLHTRVLLFPIAFLLYIAIQLNILLGIFNLLPIPPLDVSHVFRHLLPDRARRIYDSFGIILLILFLLRGGWIIRPLVGHAMKIFDVILRAL